MFVSGRILRSRKFGKREPSHFFFLLNLPPEFFFTTRQGGYRISAFATIYHFFLLPQTGLALREPTGEIYNGPWARNGIFREDLRATGRGYTS